MKLARKFFVLMTMAAALFVWGCEREETVPAEQQQREQQERPPQQDPAQRQGEQPQPVPGQQTGPAQQSGQQ